MRKRAADCEDRPAKRTQTPCIEAEDGARITEHNEDVLHVRCDYVVHQCNCLTTYASGLAHQIFEMYPDADTYRPGARRTPGTISVHGRIVNLYGQRYPGRPSRLETPEIRLGWFRSGLDALAAHIGGERDAVCAFPHGIGCGLAGGDWGAYKSVLCAWAEANPRIRVLICKK